MKMEEEIQTLKTEEPKIPVECSGCGYILGYVRLSFFEHDLPKLFSEYGRRCPKCGKIFKEVKFEVG